MVIVHQAGLINFFRTILWIVFFYYAFKYLVKYIAPFFIKRAVNNMQKKAQQNYNNQEHTTIKEGETVIDKKPTNNTTDTKNNIGEYVDFEEID